MRIPVVGGLPFFGDDPSEEPLLDPSEELIAEAETEVFASADPVFALQKMETALVRAHLERPGVLEEGDYVRLRYLLSFARLTAFEPGAAGPGGTRGRGDVDVRDELSAWREEVADAFKGPLRRETDAAKKLTGAREVLHRLADRQDEERAKLIEGHGNDFSAAELDAEVGYKSPVLVLGGGGGAGFVYVGAFRRMLEDGLVPSYVMGSSMGSIIGSVFCRELPVPVDDYITWAKSISYRAILGPETLKRRHGLFGVFSLRFNVFAEQLFRRDDGMQMQLGDLAVPFDAVVAGVRKNAVTRLPAKFRRADRAALYLRTLPVVHIGIGPTVAARLWQVGAFIDSRIVKPIVLGGDELTSQFNVVDAAAFSSAIPGVLHHESTDPRMWPLLDELCDQKDVAAIVDGGAASNVPVELAWKRVQAGRIGTRNACYLALDCFHPQWDPRHLWLQPITQALRVQLVRNAPYADELIQISPTLSPANLAPSAAAFDRAVGWGEEDITAAMPFLSRMLAPSWWVGDGPATPEHPPAPVRHVPAASMAEILESLAAVPRNAMQRFRDRTFT